jgi:predicted DNA-binding protein with PD1-like motif
MSVFLVLEVVIVELLGVDAERQLDPQSGVHLLTVLAGRGSR